MALLATKAPVVTLSNTPLLDRTARRVRKILYSLAAYCVRPEFFGVVDYGLSSLGTFLVGLFAARMLDPAELGVYALCFRAVLLGGIVPSYGVFMPAQNLLVALPESERLGLLTRSLRLGTPAAMASAMAVSLW